MTPVTSGLTFTEFEIGDAAIDAFRPWHSGEHVHERLAIDGVVGARRYVSVANPRRFLGYYRAATADVFLSPAYKALFATLSDDSRHVLAHLVGTRFIGDIVDEVGDGYGGYALRVRISGGSEIDGAVSDWFAAHRVAMMAIPGIARLMLAKPRRALDNVTDPNWILLAEGHDPRAFDTVPLPAGASAETYRLEHLWPEQVTQTR